MKTFDDWLSSHGGDRKQAVQNCAVQLLCSYREQWPQFVPTELHRLVSCHNASISYVKSLQSGACLLPVPTGFRILISEDLPISRFRMAVAHELSHTLFYDCTSKNPQRLVKISREEEQFCFDVARKILAPTWMLEATGILEMTNAQDIFRALVSQIKLSRPVAARVMISDHKLIRGVAGRWIRSENGWQLQKYANHATSTLLPRERKQLHNFALRWLDEQKQPVADVQVFGELSRTQNAAFVVVGASTTLANRA